jgi:arginyl-tRNA synthetase
MPMQQAIFDAIQAALQELGISEVDFVVERPGDLKNGDYATNAALVASKKLGKSPRDVAEELKKKLSEENGLDPSLPAGRQGPFRKEVFSQAIDRVEIAGPGFINFYLSKEAITKEVAEAATKDHWANNDLYAGKKVMVEFTDQTDKNNKPPLCSNHPPTCGLCSRPQTPSPRQGVPAARIAR